jgi:integrase
MKGQVLNYFVFAFWTGLRTGELIALRWCDVDWRHGRICVRRSRTRKKTKGPKTAAGYRWVKLFAPARAALLSQRDLTGEYRELVFHNPETNRGWSSDAKPRYYWNKAIKAADVRPRPPYQTRHTFASTLLSSGENPMFVAQVLGHRDWSMLVKTYGRWIPEVNRQSGTLVEAQCSSEWSATVKRLYLSGEAPDRAATG